MSKPSASELLLADQAYLAFKSLLSGGLIRAGQLISMSELMAQISYPMAPVREAVKKAEAIGLVQILPKRGVLVIEARPEIVRECFNLRCIFDQEGARLLASRAPDQTLRALRKIHDEVRAEALVGIITPELQRKAMDVDWSMHQALAGALDNPMAQHTYANNCDRIAVMQHSRRLLPERIIPAMEEHLLIIDAILDGSGEDAMRAVRHHFARTLHWWGIVA